MQTALRRDEQGLCERIMVEIDSDGAPVIYWHLESVGRDDDYEYEGRTEIAGWGDLDGPAAVWTRYGESVLVPA